MHFAPTDTRFLDPTVKASAHGRAPRRVEALRDTRSGTWARTEFSSVRLMLDRRFRWLDRRPSFPAERKSIATTMNG